MPKGLIIPQCFSNNFKGDMYVNTSSFNVFFWMDSWISIGRLGFPYIWGCSKFRSQQLILLSSRLVSAFIVQIIPQCFSKNFKCDMYVNTSFCLCSFGWIVGFQLADWDSHIFGDVLSFDLSS